MKKIASLLLPVMAAMFLSLATLPAQEAEKKAEPAKKSYPRGRKAPSPEVLAKRHAAAFARHGYRMLYSTPAQRRMAGLPTFDCRTALNNVLPVDDQRSCGSCYGVSAADGCSMALILAGKLPLDPSKGRLSSQYGLDYRDAFQGGCDGGDEGQVIEYIKTHGFPLTSDYGPYTASPGNPHLGGLKVYKIDDWGYCDTQQRDGIASVQSIKDAMVKYGPISVAFDASGCDGYRWPGVMKGRGNSVDHAVLCIGWDDSKNAFLGMNQWGEDWGGPNGTFWIDYQSYSWGTEAIWMTAGGPLPPPPPPPTCPPGQHWDAALAKCVPDGPTPPPPPPPGGLPTLTVSDTLPAGTYQLARPGSAVITPTTTIAEMMEMLKGISKNAAPPCCGNTPTVEQRMDRIENNLRVTAESLNKLLEAQLKK